MKMKRWMFLPVAMILALVVYLSGAGTVMQIGNPNTVYEIMLTDTCVDTVYGTVSAGDSGGYGLRVDGIDWTTYLPSYAGDVDSIWFDTSAWTDTSTFSDNDSNAIKSCNPVILPRTLFAGNIGWNTATGLVDSGSHDYTITLASVTNDSEFVITDSLDYNSQGLHVTFTFRHSTIRVGIDSFTTSDNDTAYGGRSEDSLWSNTKLSHTIAGWSFHGAKRGGNITDSVYTGDPVLIPIGTHYQWHPRIYYWYNLDSTIAKIVLQTRTGAHTEADWVPVCSIYAKNDTTTEITNWFNLCRTATLDADTTWDKFTNLGDYVREVITLVDSNSLPASYGTMTRIKRMSNLIIID